MLVRSKFSSAPVLWCSVDGYIDNGMYRKGEYIGKVGCGERLGLMCSCANWRCRLKGIFRNDLYKKLRV